MSHPAMDTTKPNTRCATPQWVSADLILNAANSVELTIPGDDSS